jgi:hypothetical protein
MSSRKERLIGMRIEATPYDFLEQLANECDRSISGMARVCVYERLSQIAAERQQPGSQVTDPTPADTGAAA